MMDVIDEGPWTRPVLNPGALDREYFAAAAEGRLCIQRCPACDHRQFPPRLLCTVCGAEAEWMEAGGTGRIHTFTVLRRHGVEPFASMVPFVLAMVELPEGVRLMGNVTGFGPDELEGPMTQIVGAAVEAYAIRVDDQLALPLWRKVER